MTAFNCLSVIQYLHSIQQSFNHPIHAKVFKSISVSQYLPQYSTLFQLTNTCHSIQYSFIFSILTQNPSLSIPQYLPQYSSLSVTQYLLQYWLFCCFFLRQDSTKCKHNIRQIEKGQKKRRNYYKKYCH